MRHSITSLHVEEGCASKTLRKKGDETRPRLDQGHDNRLLEDKVNDDAWPAAALHTGSSPAHERIVAEEEGEREKLST